MEASKLRDQLIVYRRQLDCCALVHSWEGCQPTEVKVLIFNSGGQLLAGELGTWKLDELDVLTPLRFTLWLKSAGPGLYRVSGHFPCKAGG